MEYIDESDDDYTMHSDENHIFCNVIKLWKSLKEFLERISRYASNCSNRIFIQFSIPSVNACDITIMVKRIVQKAILNRILI